MLKSISTDRGARYKKYPLQKSLPGRNGERGALPKAEHGKVPFWQPKIRFWLLSQKCGALSDKVYSVSQCDFSFLKI